MSGADDGEADDRGGARGGQAAPSSSGSSAGDAPLDPRLRRLMRKAEERGDRSVLELVPRRNLVRALALFVLLVGLVLHQRQSGSLVGALQKILLLDAPERPPSDGPRLRLEPSPSTTPRGGS